MKTKKDIAATLSEFTQFASYDQELQKHYLVFYDRKRGGIYTIMKRLNGQWSIHGYGWHYCDDGETFMNEKELLNLLWIHRSAFRQTLLALKERAEANFGLSTEVAE